MTLNHYLSQTDPERMPVVRLTPDEYTVTKTMNVYTTQSKSKKVAIRQVFINAFPGVEYVQEGTWPQLYTTDGDGNPKARSCFYIQLN